MNKLIKECFKPHVLAHSVAGMGVGFFLSGLLGFAGNTAIMLGVIIFAATVVYEMTMMKKK